MNNLKTLRSHPDVLMVVKNYFEYDQSCGVAIKLRGEWRGPNRYAAKAETYEQAAGTILDWMKGYRTA